MADIETSVKKAFLDSLSRGAVFDPKVTLTTGNGNLTPDVYEATWNWIQDLPSVPAFDSIEDADEWLNNYPLRSEWRRSTTRWTE